MVIYRYCGYALAAQYAFFILEPESRLRSTLTAEYIALKSHSKVLQYQVTHKVHTQSGGSKS